MSRLFEIHRLGTKPLRKGAKGLIQLILASEDERVAASTFKYLLPAAVKYKKRIDVMSIRTRAMHFNVPIWKGTTPMLQKMLG